MKERRKRENQQYTKDIKQAKKGPEKITKEVMAARRNKIAADNYEAFQAAATRPSPTQPPGLKFDTSKPLSETMAGARTGSVKPHKPGEKFRASDSWKPDGSFDDSAAWASIMAIKDPGVRMDEMQKYNREKKQRERWNKKMFAESTAEYMKMPVEERGGAFMPHPAITGEQTDWEQHVKDANKKSDKAAGVAAASTFDTAGKT